MNGPEHYAKAEECFAESDRIGPAHEDAGLWLDLGIGHALLAIAAALSQQLTDPYHVNGWRPVWTFAADMPAETPDEEKVAFAEWGPA